MKLIDTTYAGEEQPFTAAAAGGISELTHLQQSYTEGIADVVQTIIGPAYSPTTLYRLSGCAVTGMHGNGSSGATTITAGVLFYNGEIFHCDGQSFNWGAPAGTIFDTAIVQSYIDAAPGIQFGSGNYHQTLLLRKIVFSGQATPTPAPLGLTPYTMPVVPVLPQDYDAFTTATFATIPTSGAWANYGGTFAPGFKNKKSTGQLCGACTAALPGPGIFNIFNIGVSPAAYQTYYGNVTVGGAVQIASVVQVDTSGNVSVSVASAETVVVFLDGINYRI